MTAAMTTPEKYTLLPLDKATLTAGWGERRVPVRPRLADPAFLSSLRVHTDADSPDHITLYHPAVSGRIDLERHLCHWVLCVSATAYGPLADLLDRVGDVTSLDRHTATDDLKAWWNEHATAARRAALRSLLVDRASAAA